MGRSTWTTASGIARSRSNIWDTANPTRWTLCTGSGVTFCATISTGVCITSSKNWLSRITNIISGTVWSACSDFTATDSRKGSRRICLKISKIWWLKTAGKTSCTVWRSSGHSSDIQNSASRTRKSPWKSLSRICWKNTLHWNISKLSLQQAAVATREIPGNNFLLWRHTQQQNNKILPEKFKYSIKSAFVRRSDYYYLQIIILHRLI